MLLGIMVIAQSNAQIIITGVLKNPEGADYDGGKGYEWVQFMATEDITNATNYCIVLARNSNNTNTGWINPTTTTSYKIKIPNLTAAKGTYFYLVGVDPKFTGASSAVFPNTVNIIQFDQSVAGADGQGAAVTSDTGFFPSSNPFGIAVFDTQSPTSTTRPIDAIFAGETTASPSSGGYKLYVDNPTPPAGYTVPTYNSGSDALYFDVDNADGNSLYLAAANTGSRFYKFLGIYNTVAKKWTTVRSIGTYTMSADAEANTTTILNNLENNTTLDETPLPIQLSSFTAKANHQGVQLNWSTASEKDNSYFQVWRKVGSNANFEAIGNKIQGAGNSSTTQKYQFIDTKPVVGANYYKLQQVDNNGTDSYSKEVVAYASLANAGVVINYAGGKLNLVFEAKNSGLANVAVFDVNGRKVIAQTLAVTVGTNSTATTLDLQKGIYVVRLVLEDNNLSQKIVVQ